MGILFISILASPAHAGMFDDEEARKAILELNAKLGVVSDQLAKKSDKAVTLDQLNQIDSMREEMAKLRGQVEVLANDVNESQRRQKEFYADLDTRLRKLEPQQVVVDGKESQVEQNEQKSYDAAIAVFQSGDYRGAASALNTFIKTYSRSAYMPNAMYSLGIAYYAQKDYKNAIATFHSMVKAFPDSPKAPDAMLNIASCYTEQRDKPAAKKALQNLRAQYPDSAAAKTANDRLESVK
jgi:tol-pal system protein YbgF